MHNDDSIAFLALMAMAAAFYAFCCGFLFLLGKTYQFIAGVLA
jgi:hypothetical protein